MAWFIPLIIGILLQVVSFLLTPKPKVAKPPAAQDLEDPTAEAGRPIPVVFGTMTVKGINVLHTSDKLTNEYKI